MSVSALVLLSIISVALAQNCVLLVPASPLSPQGLSTPYVQTGCTQCCMTSFVQGAVFDPTTGLISVYNPLVIDTGTTAGCTPLMPTLPAGSTVGLWFGTNGNTLTLMDNGKGSLTSGSCINGYTDPMMGLSVFGQFAYCNGVSFFDNVKASALAQTNVPPLGTASDGQTCPTTRDFAVVDMDPNDNVVTQYILLNNGLVCQNTNTNTVAQRGNINQNLTNGSDEALLLAMLQAMGCTPYLGFDLAEASPYLGVSKVGSYAHNEVSASFKQQAPVALVPSNDPMTVFNGQPFLTKTNLYRAGAGQQQAVTNNDASPVNFCFYYYITHPARLLKNTAIFVNFPSPDAAMGDNMYTFLAQRFFNSFGANGLDCPNKLQIPAPGPITVTLNGQGVAIAALIIPPQGGNTLAFTTPLIGAATTTSTALSTTQIIAISIGTVVGAAVLVGFIVAFRAHRVRNFFSGIRDGVATKMRS